MKSILLLVVITLGVHTALCQEGWHWQNPYLQGNTLRAVNETPLWAVGDGGTAIRSLGPNFIWEKMDVNTNERLLGVSAHRPFIVGAAESEGWIVGTNGVIFHTTNSGDTWVRQNSGTTETLYAVSGSLDACVWVVGSNGTILKTSDKGETWEKINTYFNMDFFGVDHLHCNEAWIVGRDGVMISTKDGGATWTSHATRTSYHLFSIDISENGMYRACGHAGVIITSSDKGENWQKGNELLSQKLNAVDVINIFGKGYAVGDDGLILESSDNGETWTPNASTAPWDIHDVVGSVDDPSYVVGQYGVIMRNEGFGTKFEAINERFLHWLSSIEFIDENNGWAAGGDPGWAGVDIGKVLHTTDGGETWEEIYAQNEHISDMDFVDENNGWIVGKKGMIKRTSNGGESWITQDSHIQANLNAVCFVDENYGWAVSQYSDILHTSNGGATWSKQANPTKNPFHDVFFIDRNIGCAVGLSATILYTVDGGVTWLPATVNTSRQYRFASVFFLDETHAWATGIYGSIFLTEDGGKNWQEIESGTGLLLEDVFFIDKDNGWIVGDQGSVFRSVDGGYSWFEQRTPVATNYLVSAWFDDKNNGWVCGEGGTILRTKNGGFSYASGTIMHPGLNLPIQDNLATNDVIYLPETRSYSLDYQLTDIKVIIDTILHPAVQDLIITLTHDNVVDTLASHLVNGGENMLHTTFLDEASRNIADGHAPYSGDYKPEKELSVFAGMNPVGEWKLSIFDTKEGNEGVLKSWGILPIYETTTSLEPVYSNNSSLELSDCFPNPAGNKVTICWRSLHDPSTISIYDVRGRIVKTFSEPSGHAGNRHINLDVSGWAPGIYFYQLNSGGLSKTKKMIVM